MPIRTLLEQEIVGNTAGRWMLAAATAAVVSIAVYVLDLVARRRLAWAGMTNSVAGLVHRLAARLLIVTPVALALAAGTLMLDLPAQARVWIMRGVVVVFTVQMLVWARLVVEWVSGWYVDRTAARSGQAPDPALVGAMTTFRWIALAVAYVVVLLLALDNLGVNVTTLIAGLGIGGIAIALATQNILGDLFASLSITLDKPFVVGDFIIVGTEMGTIERIGIKTTRVRSLSGEQLIFSNTDLLTSRIRNYKRMTERRVLFNFGVVYQTKPDMLEQVPGIVRDAIAAAGTSRFDRCHFKAFGASSLDFEVVYFVLSPDFNVYMGIQHAINIRLAREFAARGISFAYPTQTVYVVREQEEARGDGTATRRREEARERD